MTTEAFRFEGARALVTGASSGIGAALARGLARQGVTVGLCARRVDRLSEVLDDCKEYAPESTMWAVDLADLDGVAGFALRADDELGGIDLLVNNAGIPKRRMVAALTPGEVDAVDAVNYRSPVRLTMALLPRMLERGRGTIVNVSSVAAQLSPPGEAAYAASKAALTAFSECLAVELWDDPVSVHVVYPGVIDTELFDLPDNDPLVADLDRLPPEAVVDAVIDQLESRRFESWIPDWMGDVARSKRADVDGFLAGSAAYRREQTRAANQSTRDADGD